MRLVLQPADDAAHGAWLRSAPGAYEWWYFDACSDDGAWALACIWFLGNPFSPYYRLAAQGQAADPYAHNAFYFALYKHRRLYAYHFTRFPRMDIFADDARPACLRFGPNTLDSDGSAYTLALADENANRRVLTARLTFTSPPLVPQRAETDAAPDGHCWLPAAPACRVSGEIVLREHQNPGCENIPFHGHGYHDHNWGTLPFDVTVRDWYWVRVSLGPQRALVIYHVRHRGRLPAVSHVLCFDKGRLVHHDAQAQVTLSRFRPNGFGMRYATRLHAQSGDKSAAVHLGARLDSAPFYVRALCRAAWTEDGRRAEGTGLGEYFRPAPLTWPLVASATKARIVDRAREG